MKNKSKTAWWKYLLAIVAFVAAYILAPIIIELVLKLFDFFAPKLYKNGENWISFLAHIGTPLVAAGAVEAIISEESIFVCVLMGIAALYTVFVATWNYLLGVITLITAIMMWAEAVVFIIFTVMNGVNNKTSKS